MNTFSEKLRGITAITVASMIYLIVFLSISYAEPGNLQSVSMPEMVRITASITETPPDWAVMERHLIKTMEETAEIYLDHFTRPDGTVYGGSSNMNSDEVIAGIAKGIRGAPNSDDLYEMFYNWGLFYAIGADEKIISDALKEYNAVTRMCTYSLPDKKGSYPRYGVLHNEFPEYGNFFHHSEGLMLFYDLGVAEPCLPINIQRAKRFAGLYMNEDPEAPNYDPKYKVIRGYDTGSRVPLQEVEISSYTLDPGHGWVSLFPIVKDIEPDWEKNPTRKAELQKIYNRMIVPCDTPGNLAATALVTNAYLYSGEDKYKKWVLEYVDAWMDRIKENNGIIPDNVGRTGKIGEYRNGQWWGGFYGWTSRYSVHMIFSALSGASECAYMLSGDPKYLDLLRSQIDVLMKNAKTSPDGEMLVPYKYGRDGWTDYQPMMVRDLAHLWHASMDQKDWERIEKAQKNAKDDWKTVLSTGDRNNGVTEKARLMYYAGENPDWPFLVLEADYKEVLRRLDLVQAYSIPPKNITQNDWLYHKSPVLTKGLLQVTMGAPKTIYNGGLLRARVRYFDIDRIRPGLPQDVAALVTGLEAERTVVKLVNLSVSETHHLIVQAGAFGEHTFSRVSYREQVEDSNGNASVSENTKEVNSTYFEVELPPEKSITLDIGTKCFVNKPSYAFPWHGDKIPVD